MPIYALSTRINSNVPADTLLYDLSIYRMNLKGTKYSLIDVKQQALQQDYSTQRHSTVDINEPLSTIYIMEVLLYHKSMLHTDCVTPVPFKRMYTLGEFATGKAWSAVKRENPCYFISSGITKPASQGGAVETIQITRWTRPFIAQNYPIGSPLDPFEQNKISVGVKSRYRQQTFPDQGHSSLCGPAAFFYCLQRDRPDVYAQAAQELWQYGKTKINELEISPGEGCRHPTGDFYNAYGATISGLDWITLASLRDTENTVLSYDSVDSPVAGITMWQTMTEWFEKAGYQQIFSNVGITQVGKEGIHKLNEYFNQGYTVVSLIDDSLLANSKSVHSTLPKHWVVWGGPVKEKEDGSVQLALFSWGERNMLIKPASSISFFKKRFFGALVFKSMR